MTTLTLPARNRLLSDAPLLTRTAAILLLLSLVLTLALLMDPRTFEAEPLWLKPLKFSTALALYCLTLAWAARFLPTALRQARWFNIYTAVVVACIAAEQIWVTGAAAAGLRSHYNDAQPLLIAVYPMMGIAAVILTSATAVWGWHIRRHAWTEIERAVAWSFLATCALTVPIAMTLSNAPAPGVGLPPFGWTLQPGDLRPAHFLATHAMQAVPLAALALAQLIRLPYGTGATLTAGWSALTLAAAAYGLGWL
ncbi:hypothetical protein [Jannaschia sp. M317]|uniref:hypothetical protein n=1 Tax=Jannaschia sp. M317 TaxID=2867011 RepID=UPI0021A2675C|nr:hypothetical protein [Jannaschia sp. M317]UWQ16922.1 hypothetical protein K3551_13615 [Jannaschia sp. M317]